MFNKEELKTFCDRVGETDRNFEERHGISDSGYHFYCELYDAIDKERWDDIDQSDKLFELFVAAFAKEDSE